MDLRDMLAGVRKLEYRHTAGKDQPAQAHLQRIREELRDLVPDGMRIRVSGSGPSLPVVPWIAVLNPDVTTTAQEGLYVVYLYQSDLSRVYLSMNQGTTQHLRNAETSGLTGARARKSAFEILERESLLLREQMSGAALDGKLAKIDLVAPGHFLPHGYELGNIAAIEYIVDQLPNEATLRTDLTQMLAFYDSCVEAKDDVLRRNPGELNTTSTARRTQREPLPKPPLFRPKNSESYRANISAQTQIKSRLHEALLKAFHDWTKQCGLVAANNVHPRDLTVDSEGRHWLVEAKVVKANAELAVREAIGQLFAYRHFYYRKRGKPDPTLVALFSELPGGAFLPLLESLGIESIWRSGTSWDGYPADVTSSLLRTAQANQPSSI